MPEFPVRSKRGPRKVKHRDEWTERLFEWSDEHHERPHLGTVHLKHSGTGAVEVTAEFDFKKNAGKATYRGRVPGGDTWEGESILTLKEGSPGFPPNLKVRCWNPKRWG